MPTEAQKRSIARYRLLRSTHRVVPQSLDAPVGSRVECHLDQVRLHRIGKAWRHDIPEMVELSKVAAAYGTKADLA